MWFQASSQSAQHCLIVLLEKWKKSVNQGHVFGALQTNLSKTFDCLPHKLLIAKLNAYGFDKVVRFICDYLTSRNQRTRMSDTYSSWQEILSGVTQGLILRPLLFETYIWELYFITENCHITSYADDNTPYFSRKFSWGSFQLFRKCVVKLVSIENELKGNASKWHLPISSGENVHVNIRIS